MWDRRAGYLRRGPLSVTRNPMKSTLLAVILAAACLATPALAAKRPHGWPSHRVQLGLTDSPGGAAALHRSAPFGFRYQYLAGGVNTGAGWSTWNPDGTFASMYARESLAHHITPVFTYYMIRQSLPGKNDSDEQRADLGNLQNASTMKAYYQDLELFFRAERVRFVAGQPSDGACLEPLDAGDPRVGETADEALELAAVQPVGRDER